MEIEADTEELKFSSESFQAPAYGELPQTNGVKHQTVPKRPFPFSQNESISLNNNFNFGQEAKECQEFSDISKNKSINGKEKVKQFQKAIQKTHRFQVIGFCTNGPRS